jgi:heterotetrameric sarcosine oxidase gamma subunit
MSLRLRYDIHGLIRFLGNRSLRFSQQGMRLRGRNAAQVLTKGTAVDLDPARFPVGTSAMTMIGHIGAQIRRTEEACFGMIVLRGFAGSL